MENPNAPSEKRKLKGSKPGSIGCAVKKVKEIFTPPNKKASQWEREKKEAEKAFETEHSGYHRHLNEVSIYYCTGTPIIIPKNLTSYNISQAEEERRLRAFDERMEETWHKHEQVEEVLIYFTLVMKVSHLPSI